MSIFGKVLAIVNALAVVGVLALMAMSYAKRLSWEYAVYRQDILINGLPVDNASSGQQKAGEPSISKETQQDLFRQVTPSTPVATQEDEVTRVKNALSSQVQSAGDKNNQIKELARIMTPMSDTIEERRRMIDYQTHLRDAKTFAALKDRLLAAHKAATAPQPGQAKPYEERFHDALAVTFTDPPGPFAEAFLAEMKANPNANPDTAFDQSVDKQLAQLQGQFDRMFQNALSGGENVQRGATPQQKRTIARLLFNTVEVQASSGGGGGAKADLNDSAYKRFFVVVGVKAAVEAINDQASILQELTFETRAERQRERNLFSVEHRKAVDLVLDKKAEVDHHTQLLALKRTEKLAHEATLEGRRRDVMAYEKQLAEERQKTTQNLEQLHQLSDRLFAERVKLRENSEDNQKLEKQIRTLENGR